MAVACLKSAALPLLYTGGAAAGFTAFLRKWSSQTPCMRKRRRFSGKVVIWGRSSLENTQRCLATFLQAEAVGLSFDFDVDGNIIAIKMAAGGSALLCPVARDTNTLNAKLTQVLENAAVLKVVYDGLHDILQLEKRFNIKLQYFSDVYLDASQLRKPDFCNMAELAEHCCDINLETSRQILGSSVDYGSSSTKPASIFSAASQPWALVCLRAAFVEEARRATRSLPVFSTVSEYSSDAVMIARVGRDASILLNPLKAIGTKVATMGSSTETPLAREGYPSDNGSGDRGGGGSGGPSLAESLKAAASDRDDPWAHLPLHHKSGSGSTPPNGLLSRHPLVPAMLETCAGYLAGDLWMTQCVRTESVYTLPSVKVSLATHTAFGALHTDGSTSSFHRDSPGITAADMAEETGWSTFVKDEISHIRSRVAEFLRTRDVLSLTQPVCHGSVSAMTEQNLSRVYSEAQSLRSLHQACYAPPSAVPRRSPLPTLHNLVTELQTVRYVTASSCHGAVPPPAVPQNVVQALTESGLNPTFRIPALSIVPAGLDIHFVHTHFKSHFADVADHLAKVSASASCSLHGPVRLMASSTAFLPAPL